MSIEEQIHEVFVSTGQTWKIDNEPVVPTANDIRQIIDHCKSLINGADESVVFDGLIVSHEGDGKYDVYVRLGEEND